MSLSSLAITAAESGHHADPTIPAWGIGAIALGFLLSLMVVLLMFGGGREHS